MMSNINKSYANTVYSASDADPYKDKYIVMEMHEIHRMLFHTRDTTTVTKILIFRHWWSNNKWSQSHYDVLKFLEYLNEDASYTPRQHISFMRKIRDQIIDELNLLQNH